MQLSGLFFNPLKTAKKLVEAGDWQQLLAVDRERDLLGSDARTMIPVLVAALESSDDAAIARVVAFCLSDEFGDPARLAAATRLLTWGRPDHAWQMLAVVGEPGNVRQYTALCHRVSMKTKDPAVREAARGRFMALTGGSAVAPEDGVATGPVGFKAENLAELRFPPSFGKPSARGTLEVIEGGVVAPMHRVADLALQAKFEAAVARAPDPQVYRFDDVLVNRFGQIWRPNGEVIVSSNRPIPTASTTSAMPRFDEAVLCTNATRGFFHWYAERLPSLAWRLAAGGMEAPVLIGDHAGKFQESTAALLGSTVPPLIRIGDVAHCRTVYVARNSIAGLIDWDRFGFIYETLARNAAIQVSRSFAKAIYISRRDTDRRVMENEAELESRFTALGIECLSFSDLSLAEQIHCIQGATMVLGAHGAGLTHIIGAKPGLSIIEIMPSQPGYHSLRFNYARISHVRGHDHTLWLEPINPVSRQWSVNLPSLCRLVESRLRKVV